MDRVKEMLQYVRQKQLYFICGIALILTLIRLYLYYKATYSIDMTASYDDQLFIHYARNLVDGQWLESTMLKLYQKVFLIAYF